MPRLQYSLFIAVVLMSLAVRAVVAGLERSCSATRPTRHQGICGQMLSQLVSDVCGGQYNFQAKKTHTVDSRGRHNHIPAHVFIGKRSASNFLGSDLVREKRSARYGGNRFKGITCECCTHRCSFRELTQYCLGAHIGKRHAPAERQESRLVEEFYEKTSQVSKLLNLLGIGEDKHQPEEKQNDNPQNVHDVSQTLLQLDLRP